MAIALTEFDGFCGFRPLGEIARFLGAVPALRELVGEEVAAGFEGFVKTGDRDVGRGKEELGKLYAAMMRAEEEKVGRCARELVQAARGTEWRAGEVLAELVLRLDKEFPEDIGLFCTFVLNYVTLQPGEAMFLRANEPHAYLSGSKLTP